MGSPTFLRLRSAGNKSGGSTGFWMVVPKSLVPNSDTGQHRALRGGTGRQAGVTCQDDTVRGPWDQETADKQGLPTSSAPRTTPDLGGVSLSSLT